MTVVLGSFKVHCVYTYADITSAATAHTTIIVHLSHIKKFPHIFPGIKLWLPK